MESMERMRAHVMDNARLAKERGDDPGKRLNSYEPWPGDIIVNGFSKTGTSWLNQIVHQIRTRGDEDFRDITDVSYFLPWSYWPWDFDFSQPQRGAPPRQLKAHYIYDLLPKCEGQKYLFITRNPYDTTLSLIKFVAGFYNFETDSLTDEFYDEYYHSEAQTRKGSYSELLTSWWPHRHDKDVMWIHYEDLKADLGASIRMISQFLEMPLSDEEFKRVHHFCTFDYMNKHKDKFMAANIMETIARTNNQETWESKGGLVREGGGQVGQGSKQLSPMVKALVDKEWKEQVEQKLGYKTYEDLLRDGSMFRKAHTA